MPLLGGYPGKLGAPASAFRTQSPSGPASRPTSAASPLGKPGTKMTSVPPRPGIKVQGSVRPTTSVKTGKSGKG